MGCWCRVLVMACLSVGAYTGVEASPVRSQVVFVAHDVTADGAQTHAERIRMYADVAPDAGPDREAHTRIRPLWTQGRGAHGRGSLSLDPGDDRARTCRSAH